MNKPEETFGIVVRTVADFLRARAAADSGEISTFGASGGNNFESGFRPGGNC